MIDTWQALSRSVWVDTSVSRQRLSSRSYLPLALFFRYSVAPTPTGSNTTIFPFRFAAVPAIFCVVIWASVIVPRFRSRQEMSFESEGASSGDEDMRGEPWSARVKLAQSFMTTWFCIKTWSQSSRGGRERKYSDERWCGELAVSSILFSGARTSRQQHSASPPQFVLHLVTRSCKPSAPSIAVEALGQQMSDREKLRLSRPLLVHLVFGILQIWEVQESDWEHLGSFEK